MQADLKQEVGAVTSSLLDAQAGRDTARQQLAALAATAGPEACQAAGIDPVSNGEADTEAGPGDAVLRGHLERIAMLECEVRLCYSCMQASAVCRGRRSVSSSACMAKRLATCASLQASLLQSGPPAGSLL